ncbi:MAG: NADH-quinone oxidoreductase subunit NuoK [Cyclobacteriaceae bacterium]
MITITHYLVISAILFAIGISVALIKKNAIMVLIGIELVFNAANINLVAFSRYDQTMLQGQVFALFIIVVAAAETAVALAIILKLYRYYRSTELDRINQLKG